MENLEETFIDKNDFDRERLLFDNQQSMLLNNLNQENQESNQIEVKNKNQKKNKKRHREDFGDPASLDYKGPWAAYEEIISDDEKEKQQKIMDQYKLIKEKADLENPRRKRNHNDQQDNQNEQQVENKIELKSKNEEHQEKVQKTTIYHGPTINGKKEMKFCDAAPYLKEQAQNKAVQNYIPKKWVHTFNGHDKGVQRIRFFPKYGHLMLSASHDGTCKIWDVSTNRKCLRTYMGHSRAIKDICFSNDGRKFLSAAYDRNIHLWDTETGKIIKTFTNKKTPFCVQFHPQDNKQNIFLAGCSNKKIVQYDCNSGEIVQQYEEHMGSINSVTFIENGRKFVSTADDKKIYLWEFGIPVVAKHISDPNMNSIPTAAVHPNGNHWAGQSLDDKILIYDCRGNFKPNKKKQFSGHKSQGFSCGITFSPDGQFIASGDAEGKLWFWSWKTCKNFRTINVHDGVCIDVQWHPLESSKVVTCGWDGTIKLWD